MPIKDLTDRRRFQRLGKIRLGIKKISTKTGREYPAATDYFVLADAPEVATVYGDQPRTLNVFFFFDSVEANLPHYRKRYSGRGLRCLGDGEVVYYRAGPEPVSTNGAIKVFARGAVAVGEQPAEYGLAESVGSNSIACPGEDCPLTQAGECRPTGRLHLGIREVPRLGYYELVVHQRALVGLISQMELALALFKHLCDIPFLLHLSPETVQVEGVQRAIFTPWIEIEPEWLRREFGRRGQHKQLVAAQRQQDIALLFGDDDNGDDAPSLPAQASTIKPEAVEPEELVELDYQSKTSREIAELALEDEPQPASRYARDPNTLRTLGDLFNAVKADFGKDHHWALKELGVRNAQAVADTPADCYRQLAALAQVPS